MQRFRSWTRTLVAAVALSNSPAAFGEGFEWRHARDLAGNPADLHFILAATGGERGFRIGERIPLTLAFSSDSLEKYKLNGAAYDRSGRLPTEEFILEREEVADPYADYYGAGVLGWIGGGLRAFPVLQSAPYIIELNLNDWFRFDRPGRYRLYLKSHRLTRERATGETGERVIQFAAVSNIVELEILPEDPVWEAATLSQIRAILDQPAPELPKPGGPPVPYNPLEEEITWAMRELRFLGSCQSVRLAFEHARRTGRSPDVLLLAGARNRPHMLAALDDYMADPEVAITEWDVRVRALFTLVQKDAPKPLPHFIWQVPQGAGWEKFRTVAAARQKRFEAILREEALRLVPIVAAKNPAARKRSAEAVAAIAPEAAQSARLVPPYDYGLSREDLIAQFPDLTPEQQSELLAGKWDLVRGPEMIPVLRRVIHKAKPQPLPANAMSLRTWGVGGGVAESALWRLNELSPSETARILRSDMAAGNSRFAAFAVRVFPAHDVPEADAAFREMLRSGNAAALPLLAKFATVRLAAEMRERYLGRSWPCAEEAAFLGYFVRTIPGDTGEGRAMLKRAMADREKRGCYRWLLNEVAAVTWNATIQAQAVASLEDSDPEVVRAAARVVAAHGGTDVEPLLWKRLEQWSERWRGRAAELAIHPITGEGPSAENQLGSALFEAIASAQSWLLDEPRRSRLLSLCVDEPCRKQWSENRPAGSIPVEASGGGGTYPSAFRVDGYTAPTFEALKRKLAQFPEGTRFRWCPSGDSFDSFSTGQLQEMYKDLHEFLAARSMRIEP